MAQKASKNVATNFFPLAVRTYAGASYAYPQRFKNALATTLAVVVRGGAKGTGLENRCVITSTSWCSRFVFSSGLRKPVASDSRGLAAENSFRCF